MKLRKVLSGLLAAAIVSGAFTAFAEEDTPEPVIETTIPICFDEIWECGEISDEEALAADEDMRRILEGYSYEGYEASLAHPLEWDYVQLSPQCKEYYDKVAKYIEVFDKSGENLSTPYIGGVEYGSIGLTRKEAYAVMELFIDAHPEYFYIHFAASSSSESACYARIYDEFQDAQLREEYRKKIDQITKEYTAAIKAGKTEHERENILISKILDGLVYEQVGFNHCIVGTLVSKVASCTGVSRTVKYFCDIADIGCAVVRAGPKPGINTNHTWNAVNIDGEWYYLDVTSMIHCGLDFSVSDGLFYYNKNDRDFYTNDRYDIYEYYADVNVKIPSCPKDDPATSLVLTSVGSTTASLSWPSIAGVDKYNVYNYDANKTGYKFEKIATLDVNTLNYTIKGLTPNKEYTFCVYPYKDSKSIRCFKYIDVRTTAPVLPVPSKPELIKSKAGAGQITVTCSPVKNAVTYRLFYTLDNGKTYKKVGDTDTRKWVVENLTAGKTYKFLVLVHNGEQWSKYQEGECSAPATPTIPKPAIVKSTAGAAKAVVTCSTVKGAVNYRLFYTTDNGATYKKVGDTPDRKWTVKNLQTSVEHKFLVLAYDGKMWSKYSKGECYAPAKPTVPKPSTVKAVVKGSEVTVTCSTVKGATWYRLFYTTDNGKTYTKVGDKQGRKWVLKDLKKGVEYKFAVIAWDGRGWSAPLSGEAYAPVKLK